MLAAGTSLSSWAHHCHPGFHYMGPSEAETPEPPSPKKEVNLSVCLKTSGINLLLHGVHSIAINAQCSGKTNKRVN